MSWFFGHVVNGLIRKIRLISKLMTSQLGKQTIPLQILHNISRSKCNQTMNFDLLVEYSMRNFFLEKSYIKCSGEPIPRPFFKKSELSNSLKFYTVCIYYMPNWGLSKCIETKLHTTCNCLIQSFIKKQKEVWNQSSCLIFSMTTSLVIFHQLNKFYCITIP